MTAGRLILRSLWHYRRTHLGVAAGAAVATAVLMGALLVGDSVRGSLKAAAEARLGDTQLAIAPSGRFFRDELADELAERLGVTVAPVLELRGSIEREGPSGETMYVPNVRVLGVDDRFWAIKQTGQHGVRGYSGPGEPAAAIGARLAALPGMKAEEKHPQMILAVERPGAISRDAPLTTDETDLVRARLAYRDIGQDFGKFGLHANQLQPYTVFVRLSWLQEQVGRKARANMLLVGGAGRRTIAPAEARAALKTCWTLDDAQTELRTVPSAGALEFRSRRVFLDEPVAAAAAKADAAALGVLTYLVNRIEAGGRSTPYSFVSAIGFLREPPPGQPPDDPAWKLIPPDMADDEIIINDWLARDLKVKPGDRVELSYYLPTERGGLTVPPPAAFRVRAVRAMDARAAAKSIEALAPAIPGLSDKTNCKDWRLGTRVDVSAIRPGIDDKYWRDHRGTPKAFITLAAGRRMWASRFGSLTSIRFPPGGAEAVLAAITRRVDPAELGLHFRPVRQEALAASTQGTDFSQLFAGLSGFLVVSAALLVGLLFVFSVEQRAAQTGLLLAVGLTPRRVRRLMLAEGAVLAGAGAAVGAAAAVAYTHAMLAALKNVWPAGHRPSAIEFHATPLTVVIGLAAGTLLAVGAMWLTLLGQARRPATQLLAGPRARAGPAASRAGRILAAALAVIGPAAAGAILLAGRGGRGEALAGAFFGAAALLLTALLALAYLALGRRAGEARLSLPRLGRLNAARRRWRSLATVALLACGSFVVVAVGAFRQDALAGAEQFDSGTGGFDFYGVSSLGVLHDLNLPQGRKALRLDERALAGASVVPMRVRDGDDASCLNLNRSLRPRVLGVDPRLLSARGSFTFVQAERRSADPWLSLEGCCEDGAIPAVADQTTIQWALRKKLGETIDLTDEAGTPLKVRLVGALANSILQGSLVISEKNFVEHFPGEEGWRAFLIDAPAGKAEAVRAALLSRGSRLRALGLDLTPATERLAAFTAVENTYISIFQILGGLGLLLGSVAMGVVVMRNVLERRGELAILRAVGFDKSALLRLLLYEHWLLLAGGLACGVIAGLLAAAPALASAAGRFPFLSLAATLAAVLASGAVWVYLAARFAVRGELLPALRSE